MHENDPIIQPGKRPVPLPLKIFAIALMALSALTLPLATTTLAVLPNASRIDGSPLDTTTLVIVGLDVTLICANCILGLILGIDLLRNKRRHARHFIEALILTHIGILTCSIMIGGIGRSNVGMLIRIGFYIALMVYIDPSLSTERRLKRKVREFENRKRAEDGTLGKDETGRGYIELNFFNLFWIFVVCCVIGIVVETVYVFAMTGHYQDRTGMLYGPFSPIYGIGALLMTVTLNRFHKSNAFVIFLVSALIGGAFEYFVSWFLQFAFGITAWDYTGQFLSIHGRTCGKFMVFWGILGCLWIKLLLPRLLALINRIPWNWRYGVTTVCAALMLVNASMTLMALDCWYQREAGLPPQTAVECFFAKHYDNEFMKNHFQTMTINPDTSTRAH